MKKLISLTLAALFGAALLAGCNNTPAPTPGGEEVLRILDTAYAVEDYAIAVAKDNTALLDQINTALAELKDEDVLAAIVDKYIDGTPNELTFQTDVAEDAPVLTMGTNAHFPPYEFYDGDAIVGIDAEVAAAIADKLGMKLEIQDMEFDSVLVAVQTGSIDIGMAGITVTDSYATGVQSIIVKADSPITSVDDLFAEGADHKIGTQMATTGYLYATWDIEDEGLGTVEGYSRGADAVLALINGQVDCVIIDNAPAQEFVAFHNGTK